MKLKFLVLLFVGCLSHLAAASEEETFEGLEEALPVFAFNHEVLVKPAETACMQWLELLEIERNKADYLGNFAAFKAFTKEISATIGGKYGFSIPSTPEETIALSYSIIRTRHKFCGKRNMVGDFYGVRVVTDDPEVQHYLSLVMAIDTMAAKAINDEDDTFFDQWTAVSQTGATHDFIEAVRKYELKEKSSLFAALDDPLTAVLTDGATMVTIKEVFDIFAPKITLKKIYSEMMVSGGEYRGWTVHGADAFAYLVNFSFEDRVSMQELIKGNIRNQYQGENCDLQDVLCCSSAGSFKFIGSLGVFSSESKSVVLHYVYDLCLKEQVKRINSSHEVVNCSEIGPKDLYLVRFINPILANIFAKAYSQVPEEKILAIYKHRSQFIDKFTWGGDYGEDITFLMASGDTKFLPGYIYRLSNGGHRFERDIAKAVELCREAIDLGNIACVKQMPSLLIKYAISLMEKGTISNAINAIEICREAADLGSVDAKKRLPNWLRCYSEWFFNGENGVVKDLAKAIEVAREAVVLGDKQAKHNLYVFLNEYAGYFLKGQNGFRKNLPRAIELLREATSLSNDGVAKENLSIALNDYAYDLDDDGNDLEKDLPRAIEFLREATSLSNDGVAKENLSITLNKYACLLWNGNNDIKVDLQKAIELCREAAVLGNNDAKLNLPEMLSCYSIDLFNGENSVTKDIAKAIELCREAAVLGDKIANYNLPIFLNKYAGYFLKSQDGFRKNLPRAIELCREAANLGDKDAKLNLSRMLNGYAATLWSENNVSSRDHLEIIEMCRESVSLGNKMAKENLRMILSSYAIDLFSGKNGIVQDIPHAITVCREAADLGNEDAIRNLPLMIAAAESH